MKTLSCIAVVGMLIVASTIAKASELSLTIMGSGSPDYNEERASAGFLGRQGDTQILVDMGPSDLHGQASCFCTGADCNTSVIPEPEPKEPFLGHLLMIRTKVSLEFEITSYCAKVTKKHRYLKNIEIFWLASFP